MYEKETKILKLIKLMNIANRKLDNIYTYLEMKTIN